MQRISDNKLIISIIFQVKCQMLVLVAAWGVRSGVARKGQSEKWLEQSAEKVQKGKGDKSDK